MTIDEVKTAQAQSWLAQARWLWSETRARYDTLGQHAYWVLATDGLIIGLMAKANAPHHYRWLWTASAVLIGVSSLLALASIHPKWTNAVNVHQFRQQWSEFLKAGPTSNHIEGTFVEAMLHGSPSSQEHGHGPLESLGSLADWQGRKNRWATYCLAIAITCGALAVALGG